MATRTREATGWASLVDAHRASDRIAITTETRTLGYAEWARLAERLARALLALGLRRPARVGLLMPNGPDFAIALLACARIGVTIVPLSTWAAPGELRRVLSGADVAIIVASDQFPEALRGLAATAAAARDAAPPTFVIGEHRLGFAPFAELLAYAESCDEHLWAAATGYAHDDADLAVLYTSGSTGLPKGVILTQGAVRRNALAIQGRMGLDRTDRVYSYFPMFFSGGLCNVLSGAAAAGAELVTQPRYEPHAAASLIRARRCTAHNVWFDGLTAIAASPGFRAVDLARMRRGLIVDPALLERFGLPFDEGVNMYGSTETATAFTCHDHRDPEHIRRRTHGSPLPGNSLRVVDPDTGRPLRDGEIGEIVVRGPNLMRGYTDGSHEAVMEDGWFHTGDLGSWADRQLVYTGRMKTLIKIKGLTVQPEEIEAVLRSHELVDKAVVVSIGARDAESLCALVTIAGGHAAYDLAAVVTALDAHCREELSSYKRPRIRVIADDRFPLSGSRKVDRQAARITAEEQ